MGDMTEYYTDGIEFSEDANGVPLCDKCRTYHEMDEECPGDITMVEKNVTCIGCNDKDINMFMSCMTCRLSSHPGECTEFRYKYDMVIEMRVLPWSRIVEM